MTIQRGLACPAILLLFGGVAVAQGPQPAVIVPEPVPPEGTPMLADVPTRAFLEAGAGALVSGGLGMEASVVAGVGSRIRRLPLALFLAGELAYAGVPTERRSWLDLTLGLRTSVLFSDSLAVTIDLLGGSTFATEEEGDPAVLATGFHPTLIFATGIQRRVLRHLWLGGRLKLRFTNAGTTDLRSQFGLFRAIPLSVMATLTVPL